MNIFKSIFYNSEGYTLIEIIIVVIIIATLSTIAILNISGFTQSASENVVTTNMRSLLSEIEAYAAQNKYYPGENDSDFDAENFISEYKNELNALAEIVDELGDYDEDIYYYEIENDDYVFSVKVNENYLRISKSKTLETDAEGHLKLEDL